VASKSLRQLASRGFQIRCNIGSQRIEDLDPGPDGLGKRQRTASMYLRLHEDDRRVDLPGPLLQYRQFAVAGLAAIDLYRHLLDPVVCREVSPRWVKDEELPTRKQLEPPPNLLIQLHQSRNSLRLSPQ
jgi:hypothetical protein